MRELTAPQGDDLYEVITEWAGKSLILTELRERPQSAASRVTSPVNFEEPGN